MEKETWKKNDQQGKKTDRKIKRDRETNENIEVENGTKEVMR